MWLNGCNFHILCHHHTKLGDNRHSASGDIMLLICHLNEDQTFPPGEFEERNDRSKLINLNNRYISRLNDMQNWISQMDQKNPLKWTPKPARRNSTNLYTLFLWLSKSTSTLSAAILDSETHFLKNPSVAFWKLRNNKW